MIIYIDTKLMTFEEDNMEHEIVLKVSDKEFYGYDIKFEFPDDNKFINDTLKENGEFAIREEKTWNSFPLYEIVDGKIVKFDYTLYAYFIGADRRMALALKINDLYNPFAETKIIRKTIKKILDHLGIVDESFEKYNTKVDNIINKNQKN